MARVLAAVVVLVVIGLGGCSRAGAVDYRTFRPEGPGPFPAVMFVSGCSGFAPSLSPTFYAKTAERLRGEGQLVIFVDYLGARGLRSCAGTISHEEAGRDVMAALAHLRSQPNVRVDAITAIGWSYGGGAIMAALEGLPAEQTAPFRAVLLYPDCRRRTPWKAPTDVLVLLAGNDDVAPPDRCRDTLGGSAAPARIQARSYPQALHAFDVDELPARTTYPFGTIGYHKESAAAAWAEIDRFLEAGAIK